MYAFAYMNLVEAWGSGIPKLMRAMKEYGLRDPEATQAQYAVEFPGCLHPWDPDSCGEGQQHSAESAAV